jgi:hypothetical protein
LGAAERGERMADETETRFVEELRVFPIFQERA